MNFNMIKNELNKILLRLYKLIAEMTKNILIIFDTLSDINTTAIHVALVFDHYFLRISVYYSCRNYFSVIKILFYKRQILYFVRNNKCFFNHMNNENVN